MRIGKTGVACFVPLFCFAATEARGAVIYSYAAGASSYTGVAGTDVAVNIYLNELLTNSSTSFIAANGGLGAAGAAVNVSSTTGGSAAGIGAASFTEAVAFDGGPLDVDYNQGTGNNLEFTEGVASTAVDTFAGQVFLGTVDVTVGTGTTTYSLSSLDDDRINGGDSELGQSDGNTLVVDPKPLGTDLDAANASFTGADLAAPFTFTVAPLAAVVPEPACVALLSLGTWTLLGRRRSV